MIYRILLGDALANLQMLPSESYDAIFCDPPYGLSFMNKAWDHGVPSVEVWAECLRVLKPGGFCLAFGGTRTYHRLTCNIEDAGFEIRDCLMWLYGSGFPKSMDISKAIDKSAGIWRGRAGAITSKNTAMSSFTYARTAKGNPVTAAAAAFDGYGTALKPAYEPCVVAMKPVDGTFSENALKHDLAGININSGRVAAEKKTGWGGGSKGYSGGLDSDEEGGRPVEGRWPANLILDAESAQALDAQTEEATSRFFYCAKVSSKEREAGCDELSEIRRTDGRNTDRQVPSLRTNPHPTLKPIDLTQYVSRMLLPPERDTPRKLLVPFSGAGSEMIGALRAGWDDVTGIELESNYVKIALARLKHWTGKSAELTKKPVSAVVKSDSRKFAPGTKPLSLRVK